MKRFLLIIALAIAGRMMAQTYLQGGMVGALSHDRNLSGCNYASYFTVYDYLKGCGKTKLSRTPKGYEPFYITTYARHGSRWLGSAKQYDLPANTLKKADESGALTEEGKNLLNDLTAFRTKYCPDSSFAQLTEIGHRQHIGIARRMCHNFPKIFDSKGSFYAQSSEVRRCVESMQAEASIIDSVIGRHIFTTYGQEGMQERLAGLYKTDETKSWISKADPYHSSEVNNLTPYKTVGDRLFTNTDWTTKDELIKFTRSLFDVIGSIQNVTTDVDLWHYFTLEEVNNLWEIKNREWFRMHGNSATTNCMGALEAKWLMEDILAGADTIANRTYWHGANLRFGHDLSLAPLACLMELGTTKDVVTENQIDSLNKTWRVQEIAPMGGNVQIIFYRLKRGYGDVLVKVLLNEVEVTLPGRPVTGKYYRWDEIKERWMKNLEK